MNDVATEQEEVLEFSLVLEEKKIRLFDENKEPQDFILRELTGKERDKWMTSMATKVSIGKESSVSNFDGIQANLLALAMRYSGGERSGEALSVTTIQSWPSKVQTELFKLCQEMSGLGEDADEKEGED